MTQRLRNTSVKLLVIGFFYPLAAVGIAQLIFMTVLPAAPTSHSLTRRDSPPPHSTRAP